MPAYVEDFTGTNPANLITNELHPVSNVQNSTHRTIVPNYAPFYEAGFDIEHVSASNVISPMIAGIDYKLSLEWIAARESLVMPIYGGITVYTNFADGNFRIKTYQTIGGTWVADSSAVIQTILTMLYNPRVVYWEQVTNVPTAFPPDVHMQPASDLTRLKELIDSVNLIKDALLNGTALSSHATDPNPHPLSIVSAIEVGTVLTAIDNDTTSSLSTAIKGRYVTVEAMLDIINGLITKRLL